MRKLERDLAVRRRIEHTQHIRSGSRTEEGVRVGDAELRGSP